jgi:p-aminobenzoyl-glutamate transporter AbgT
MEHAVPQPLVAVYLSVVRKLIHAELYSFESLIVFCIYCLHFVHIYQKTNIGCMIFICCD